MEELEGIGEIIMEKLRQDKKAKIKELATYLNLSEDLVWDAVSGLMDKGLVFQPSEDSVAMV